MGIYLIVLDDINADSLKVIDGVVVEPSVAKDALG